jgi:prepilin-type N-terminal cleavage/methylation domain-containing protein
MKAHTQPRTLSSKGFTIVELMIVVVILGVLAAVAGPVYFRHRNRAMAVEASETLAKIVSAQEGYRAEFGMYSDVSNDPSLSASSANGTLGTEGTWWPALGAPAAAPSGTVDFYAALPLAWNQLGVRPRRMVRYSFQTIAGNPGVTPAVGVSGNLGYPAAPSMRRGQWFFAAASGDLDHDGVYSRFEVSSLQRELHVVGRDDE